MAELEAKVRELLNRNASNSSLPPSANPPGSADASALTDGPVCTGFARRNDIGRERMRLVETTVKGEGENTTGRKPHVLQEFEAGCDSVIAPEGSSPSRTRTYNKPVNSRLLYH